MNRPHLCLPLNSTLMVNSLPKSAFFIDASLNCMNLFVFQLFDVH
jgi:hypothetical protein